MKPIFSEKCGALNYDQPIWLKERKKPAHYDCVKFKGHDGDHSAKGFCKDWPNINIVGEKGRCVF